MLNLSHMSSGSEIPERYETDEASEDAPQLITRTLSSKERIIECLRDAGGDSLSAAEIAEETGLPKKKIQKFLEKVSNVELNSREVFEDENAPGSYFLTEPLFEKLAVGF